MILNLIFFLFLLIVVLKKKFIKFDFDKVVYVYLKNRKIIVLDLKFNWEIDIKIVLGKEIKS